MRKHSAIHLIMALIGVRHGLHPKLQKVMDCSFCNVQAAPSEHRKKVLYVLIKRNSYEEALQVA